MKDYSKELTSEQKTVKAFTDPLNEQIRKLTYENEYLKEQLRIANVGKRSELLLFDEYIYSNECQHDRDRGGFVDRYLAKK